MRVIEELVAWGHANITGRNTRTFEITKDQTLTKRGDCIIAVGASKGVAELSDGFKEAARKEDSKITISMHADSFSEIAIGEGNPKLSFTHKNDLVARKSFYICNRTLMIHSDKAAIDFSRDLIQHLKNPKQKIIIQLIAQVYL